MLCQRFGWLPARWAKGWPPLAACASVGVVAVVLMLWLAVALAVRRGFQFSLRSLLGLVVAVAIPCSWFVTEMRSAKRQAEAARAVETFGGVVTYDYNYDFPNPNEYRAPPECLRNLLGTDFFSDVLAVKSRVSPSGRAWWWPKAGPRDADLAHFESLGRLRRLCLDGGTHITDAGLEHISKLSGLRELSLEDTGITGVGLAYLERLSDLTTLDFSETPVGDRALEHLRGMNKLQILNLSATAVTDSGLEHLARLTALEILRLNRTLVTGAGLEHVAGLENLNELWLIEARVTDEGLSHIKGLRHLRILRLALNPRISDAGLKYIEGLTQLEELDLINTGVSDAGLDHLAHLVNLRQLFLDSPSTSVTDAGVKKLQGALPHCAINPP